MDDHFDSLQAAARLPAVVGQVLRLFQTELAEVAFPGLGRSVLETALEALAEELKALDQTRALMHTQEVALAEHKQALVRLSELGLAYARVFASENAALQAAVEQIPSPRRRSDTSPKERKPKVSGPRGEGQLPLVSSVKPAKRGRSTHGRAELDPACRRAPAPPNGRDAEHRATPAG